MITGACGEPTGPRFLLGWMAMRAIGGGVGRRLDRGYREFYNACAQRDGVVFLEW
jgi:hypothetical protein